MPNDASAMELSRELVERRLAACVNTVSGITSLYRWKDKIEESAETLLVIKTTSARYQELESAVREKHPYDTPEIVALSPSSVFEQYLGWVSEVTENRHEHAKDEPGPS